MSHLSVLNTASMNILVCGFWNMHTDIPICYIKPKRRIAELYCVWVFNSVKLAKVLAPISLPPLVLRVVLCSTFLTRHSISVINQQFFIVMLYCREGARSLYPYIGINWGEALSISGQFLRRRLAAE